VSIEPDLLPHRCASMDFSIEHPNVPIDYDDRFREFFVKDAPGEAAMVFAYCPFCGQPLPTSMRQDWFETLEQRGIDVDILEASAPRVPADMRDGAWWRVRATVEASGSSDTAPDRLHRALMP
jgi:hypothetical protein